MPVATVVGGTAKLLTIPPSATGSEATLKDMIIWPSAIAIIGTHDARACSRIAPIDIECVAMVSSRVARLRIDRAIGSIEPLSASASVFRLRYEQIHSQPLRQEFCRQLSLHAVAGRVERRRESPEAALARRDRDDAAADPALARQADVIEPVARGLVQSRCYHHRQRIVTDSRVDHALPGDRIDTAIGQRRAHHREIPGADVQRALPGIEIGGLLSVAIDAVVALQQPGDTAVAIVRLRRRGINLLVE